MIVEPGSDVTSNKLATLARLVGCIDENEFAALAGVKLSTLKAWRKRGTGPNYALLGNSYLYPIPEVGSHLLTLVRQRKTLATKMKIVQ